MRSVASDPAPRWPTGRALWRARAAGWRAWRREARALRVFLFYPPGPGPMLASALRRRWLVWRNPHVHFEFAGPVYLGPGFSVHAPHGGRMLVGPGDEFRRNFRAEFGRPDTVLSIGEMTAFTYDVVIQCTTSVRIGRHCTFGQAAMIVDGNHRFFERLDRPPLANGYDYRPLVIDDYVTVTSKVTIMADIGTRALIAAGAVVNRPIPAYCLAGGVPARVLADHTPPEAGAPAAALDVPR